VTVVRVTDQPTRLDIAKAVTALRAKQMRAETQAVTEVQAEIDALLDGWESAR
jgi:hypothetical protein